MRPGSTAASPTPTPASAPGLTGRYYRNIFRDRLQAQIAAGLYTTQAGEFDASYGSILLGLRYTF